MNRKNEKPLSQGGGFLFFGSCLLDLLTGAWLTQLHGRLLPFTNGLVLLSNIGLFHRLIKKQTYIKQEKNELPIQVASLDREVVIKSLKGISKNPTKLAENFVS